MADERHGGRPLRSLLGAIVTTALPLLAACWAGGGEPASAALGDPLAPPPPNVVVIRTDDQPAQTVTRRAMPNLHELLIDPGTSFTDHIVTTPLCCPSRATTLTGQYGHNNGVLVNDYAGLLDKDNVLPAWLQAAGYRTAHVGKFLNGYGSFAGSQREVAPGWDLWFSLFENKSYYGWRASKNGKTVSYGERDDDHLTEVLNRRAVRWAKKLAKAPEPFFLQLDHFAPHGSTGRDRKCLAGPVPGPRDESRFAQAALPQPPSYNEPDVSDKPAFISGRAAISEEQTTNITRRWRCTLGALYTVDRGIRRLVRQVERQGELERTVFIFTSDNGYYFGEHRIARGKTEPYEENLRMPLVLRVPGAYLGGAAAPVTSTAPAANLDLAPTILELARAQPCAAPEVPGSCRVMDGRSLLPLLDGRGGWPAERELLIELSDCQYRGVRAAGQIYIEHGSGPLPTTGGCRPSEAEHYDLAADPYQLDNIYPAPRRTEAAELELELSERIAELSECAGIAGRDPAPASGVYCD